MRPSIVIFVLLMVGIAVVASVGFRERGGDRPADDRLASLDGERGEHADLSDSDAAGDLEVALTVDNEPPAPGSMQATLLAGSDDNRRQILRLTLLDAGLECSDVRSANPVGDSGSSWRANCGDGLIYMVDINDLGGFEISPMPYGDLSIPGQQLRRIFLGPNERDPALELRERMPELERNR